MSVRLTQIAIYSTNAGGYIKKCCKKIYYFSKSQRKKIVEIAQTLYGTVNNNTNNIFIISMKSF